MPYRISFIIVELKTTPKPAMCSAKTRNKGSSKHKGMSPSINYKISDVRKLQKLEYED